MMQNLSRVAVVMFLALLASPVLALPADAEPVVDRILQQFEAAKPSDKSLAFYSLDWATDLRKAKKRAFDEQRPIFLILNTNITAGTNLYSGHT